MKLQLVDDWRDCWRWYSTHCLAIAAALQGVWLELPPDLKSALPAWTIHAITMLVLVCGFFGRLLEQPRGAPP